MHKLPRILAALLAIVMFAAACGSSDGDNDAASESNSAEVEVGDTDTSDAETGTGDAEAGDPDESDASDDGDAMDESETAESDDSASSAAAESEAQAPDPTSTEPEPDAVINLVQNLTQHTPNDIEVACVLVESDENEELRSALVALNNPDWIPTDGDIEALTRSFNGCIDGEALAGFAGSSLGLTGGPGAEETLSCLDDRFSADDGDDSFYGLAAAALGFTVAEDSRPTVVTTLTTCAPVANFADVLAGQAENRAGFTIEVDRDCVTEGLDDPEISEVFWTSALDQTTEGQELINAAVIDCQSEVTSGLPDVAAGDFEPWAGIGSLAAFDPASRNAVYDDAPPFTIDTTDEYEAVITTDGGEIRVRLFADTAPNTVNNFVSLARDGFYDGTVWHRVIEGFMAQAGDPTGTGTGGPGYRFGDEVDDGPALDRRGLLAMANSGPDTNGSQFFITFEATEWLTGLHTVFGEVVEGDDVLAGIAPRDPQAPTDRGQVIESILIIEN